MRVLASLFVLLLAAGASAQVGVPASHAGGRAGQLRIGASTSLVGLTAYGDAQHVLLGPGAFVRTSGTDVPTGPLSGTRGLRVEAAYWVSDAVAVGLEWRRGFVFNDLGAPLPLEPGQMEADPGSRTTPSLAAFPFVERLFGEGDVVPYLGLGLGFAAIFPEGTNAGTRFLAGALGGVHLFVIRELSVSFELDVELIYDGLTEATGVDVTLALELAGWV
jgi:hypothetical protein